MKSILMTVTGLAVTAGAAFVCRAEDTPPEWGRPGQGVVAGLRNANPSAAVGQPLVFRLEVHNPTETEVTFPHLGRFEAWRLQFESAVGELYEYRYSVRDIRQQPLSILPGGTATVELPVMQPKVIANFMPVSGLTELPPGRYRVRAFAPFHGARDERPKAPLSLELGTHDRPDWIISNVVEVEITGPAVGDGWTLVGDALRQQNYRRLSEQEEIFTGTLEGLPPPPKNQMSSLMRSHGYRLGDRLIAGRDITGLDALIGKKVELRGKRVDMSLSGVTLREIAPGAVRPAE